MGQPQYQAPALFAKEQIEVLIGLQRMKNRAQSDRYRSWRTAFVVLCTLLTVCAIPRSVQAQELEPRLLTKLPVGMNFALLNYGYSKGDILLDPALPIEDLDADINTFVGGYLRSLTFFDISSKIDILVPYVAGSWEGLLAEQDTSTSRNGFGDPRLRFAVNFLGNSSDGAGGQSGDGKGVVIGGSLQMTVPLGQYYPDKLINLGSNRWTFRPQLGAAVTLGNWILETYLSARFFTKNPDFYGGNELKQLPLGAIKLHAIYTMPRVRSWLALDVGYALGGRTEVNGQLRDTRISTFRLGLTLAVPIVGNHTVKITALTGKRHERGPEFNALAATYQYSWGGVQ